MNEIRCYDFEREQGGSLEGDYRMDKYKYFIGCRKIQLAFFLFAICYW